MTSDFCTLLPPGLLPRVLRAGKCPSISVHLSRQPAEGIRGGTAMVRRTASSVLAAPKATLAAFRESLVCVAAGLSGGELGWPGTWSSFGYIAPVLTVPSLLSGHSRTSLGLGRPWCFRRSAGHCGCENEAESPAWDRNRGRAPN